MVTSQMQVIPLQSLEHATTVERTVGLAFTSLVFNPACMPK